MVATLRRSSWMAYAGAVLMLALQGTRAIAAGEQAAVGPVGWVEQHPFDPIVRSLRELTLSANGKMLNEAAFDTRDMQTTCWEIRTADNRQRAAVMSIPWNLSVDLFKSWGSHIPSRDEVRSVPSLAAGDYLVAGTVKGKRCSNVVPFTIDPHKDAAKLPAMRLLQLEPMKAGALPLVMLYVTRRTAADPAFNHFMLAMTTWSVDDRPLVEGFITGESMNYPMEVGQTFRTGLSWQSYNYKPDPAKPHTVRAQLGNRVSPSVALETGTPLGDAWDLQADLLGPAPAAKTTLAGSIMAPDGGVAEGYDVILTDKTHMYSDLSDEDGRCYFRNIPAGDYSFVCTPKGKILPTLMVSKVRIEEGAKNVQRLTASLAGKFAISGKVTRADGSPATKVQVKSAWVSDDGSQRYETATLTDEAGAYTAAGPFAKVATIEAAGGDTVVRDATAPGKDVNLRMGK